MKRLNLFGILWIILSSFLFAQTHYKYSYVPKKVYKNQIFPITIIGVDKVSHSIPNFEFDAWSSLKPLSKKPLVITNSSDSFYTFYFKASSDELNTPRIFITDDGYESMLDPKHIKTIKLKTPKNFCGVIATDLKILNYQISNYDDNSYLVTLSIEALEANLEDMHITGAIDEGMEKLHRHFAKLNGEFFVILPTNLKNLKFSYFNSLKKQFEEFDIKLEIADSSVTTQSELNPKYDSFDLLKKYILMFLVAFFIIMFILRKDFFYLIFGVLSLITLLTLYIPHKKICIKAKSKIYILPTHTSQISSVVSKDYITTVLGEHNHYKKIEYKNHTIGWIKDEDVCKD